MARPELVPAVVSSSFLVGLLLTLLGSIRGALAERLSISELRAGGMLAPMFIALIPLMLVSGYLIDRWGPQWVLLGGSFVSALGLSALALARRYLAAWGAASLIGAGTAGLSSSCMVLMPWAFFPEDNAGSANLGTVFFGIGALVTPSVAGGLVRWLGLQRTLGIFGLVALVPALSASFGTQAAFQVGAAGNPQTDVFHQPLTWLLGAALLLYMPLETTLGTKTAALMGELAAGERYQSLCLPLFWTAFLTSRLGAAFLDLPAGVNPWEVLILATVSAVALGNLAGAVGQGYVFLGVVVLGAALGPIFPTLIGILFDHTAMSQRGMAYGAIFAIGTVGNLLLTPLIGVLARNYGVRPSLWVAMLLALLLAAASLLLGLWLQMAWRQAH